MNYVLFDNPERDHLLPLVFTRPVADIRIGILTIREKWETRLNKNTSTITQSYLSKRFPTIVAEDNLFIDGSVLPGKDLVEEVQGLRMGETLMHRGSVIAARMSQKADIQEMMEQNDTVESKVEVDRIHNTWDIFAGNAREIENDFELLTSGRKSAPLSETNFIRGPREMIFLEEGAHVEHAFLNVTEGPIYVGKDAEIMEGAKVRGPFALCRHAALKMDAKIYGGTTVGPHSKVGGEVQNTVFFGYSNKGHDGYLGNAVVGEWCNFGADTNNSNLKNTYDIVKVWSYPDQRFVRTGLQFCGLIMGDHSKTGINTMFNTGTVIGVSCNLFGAGFQRNFIPSFSWGGPHGMMAFNLKKSFDVAKAVMKRRDVEFDEIDQEILSHIYQLEQNK